MDLLDSGALPTQSLIEPHDAPLSGVMDAMERLSRGEIPSKVMVRPDLHHESSAFTPRINHVAISVDAEVLDDVGRAALLDFYSEVFGWIEGDNSTETGNPLILYTGSLGEFAYLLPARDEFMVTPNMDHFGMEVSSKDEMHDIIERVRAYQRKDERAASPMSGPW